MMFANGALCMLGVAHYLLLAIVVLYRLIFLPLNAAQCAPTYWIGMGAAAISALAGAELERNAAIWHMQLNARLVLQGFTLFFWVIATIWIPLLIGLGFWRHVAEKHSLRYDP